ncbi:hypothetical protein CYMTET_3230 [Cymbomonas tetramitiformis]|uniref:Uncharacterized protein n=1 Tax=Cymbomonas tetramitiformis TaxID=36881 RepID=A0AAE0H3V4_9CHLO|nr:hypothetical protein CYMTET_3230 [Cymbomonas tetramitiformis]
MGSYHYKAMRRRKRQKPRIVPAIKEAFITEDPQFSSLFDLDDAVVAVRGEANRLLFSTLELIIAPGGAAADWLETSADTHPFDGKRVLFELARRLLDTGSPFSGTQTLLGVRVAACKDPQDAIAVFSSALASARRKNTLDDDEVKGLFINALDPNYYAPVVNRLLLHDQRALADLATIQQWVRECHARNEFNGKHTPFNTSSVDKHVYAMATDDTTERSALSDLSSIVLDLKKQVAALTAKLNGHGFTPRSAKAGRPGTMKTRFAAGDLPTSGNWPQGLSKKIVFDKNNAQFVPVCGHSLCRKGNAKHWHRDCPHGGPRAEKGESASMNAFATADYELDFLATNFQTALDEHDSDRFNALCILAGGRPELVDEIPATALDTEDVSAPLDEYAAFLPPAGVHIGTFSVGNAIPQPGVTFASIDLESANCANAADDRPIEGSPLKPPPGLQPQTFIDGECPFHETFMDKFCVSLEEQPKIPAFHSFNQFDITNDNDGIFPYDSDDDSEVFDKSADRDSVVSPPPQPPPTSGGAFSPSFARFAMPFVVLAFCCVCATAAPITACGVGGVSQTAYEPFVLAVGGAAREDHPLRPEPPPSSNSPSIFTTSPFTAPVGENQCRHCVDTGENFNYDNNFIVLRAGPPVNHDPSSG